MRFHALPDSKRYPETLREHTEVLRRHQSLTGEIFGPDDACWFVTATYERANARVLSLPDAPGISLDRALVAECPDALVADGLTIWAASATWSLDRFDAARRAIVVDRVRALWVSQASAEIFAPYDGGVDLILGSAARRDALAERYGAWLPRTTSGL